MQIGTPSQYVRLLPATSGSSPWVVLPKGCPEDLSDCASRGFSFDYNQSSTWSLQGFYRLPLTTQNLSVNQPTSTIGYDTITLGLQGSGLRTLAHQVIVGFWTKNYFIGSLGLNITAANLTNLIKPQPSMLQNLRDESKIPSLSWSYTAGAYYRKTFGSLTLGGFDTTRFEPNNVSFHFDLGRGLLVGIQSITTDSSGSPLLPTGIYALIDSFVPHIELPREACQAFEDAFGLVWDDSSQLYLVSEDRNNKLVELNPNVTFRLGPSLTGGDTVDIVMPYRSFDLIVKPPLVKNSTRYFPLKRAQNDTQYTLGRAFLQQAYVIADFDRSNFSVHQALFPNISVPPKLSPILPPGVNVPPLKGKGSLSTGAIVGIVVAILFVIILCCIVAIFMRRRRRRRIAAKPVHHQSFELGTSDIKVPQDDSNSINHLDSKLQDDAHGAYLGPQEMPTGEERSPDKSVVVSELPTGDNSIPELEGQSVPRSKIKTPPPDYLGLDPIASPTSIEVKAKVEDL